MGLETGSFVEDLVVTNPPGGDSKSQGDDHLRLIKTVLRGTFKRATKAFSFPGSVSKSANYTVLSTDDGLTILCDTTSAAFTLTLPTLVSGDAGWNVFVIKTNAGANPVFVAPPSGTINGYSKVRRTIPNAATRVLWTGGAWVATRPDGRPIGSTTGFYGTALPDGYLWCDGASFTAANFVELNTVLGVNATPDLKGRGEFGRDDMGGTPANRITNAGSGIVGTTLKAAGGVQSSTLSLTELPVHDHTFTTGGASADHTHSISSDGAHQHNAFIGDDGHSHTIPTSIVNNAGGAGTGITGTTGTVGTGQNTGSNTTGVKVRSTAGNAATADSKVDSQGAHSHGGATGGVSANHFHSGTTDPRGSGAAFTNVPPIMICNKIMLAE